MPVERLDYTLASMYETRVILVELEQAIVESDCLEL